MIVIKYIKNVIVTVLIFVITLVSLVILYVIVTVLTFVITLASLLILWTPNLLRVRNLLSVPCEQLIMVNQL